MLSADELDRQGAALRRLARRLVADPDTAEDVVQDAWLQALERPPRRTAAITAWMRRAVRGLSVDAVRRHGRRARLERTLVDDPAATDPNDALHGLDLQMVVLEAVRSLPEPYRSTVWQRYFESRPPRDIATRDGLPIKTVKTRLHRALAMLRERLDAEHGNDRRAWTLPLASFATPVTVTPLPPPTTGIDSWTTTSGPTAPLSATTLWSLAMKTTAVRLSVAAVVVLGAFAIGWSLLDGDDPNAPPPDVEPTGAPPAVAVEASEPSAPEREEPVANVPEPVRRDVVADAPPPAPQVGTLSLRILWWDREPAAGIGISLRPSLTGIYPPVLTREVTGTDGSVMFADLEPGTYRVRTDRNDGCDVEIRAGEATDAEHVLARGVDVEGSVTHADGRPAAGAGVWLQTWHTDWAAGRRIAAAGSDGRFALRSIPAGASLGALAPTGEDARPSKLVDLDLLEARNDVVTVRLELGAAGGRVVGRVVAAEDGRPIAGARVAFGKRNDRIETRGDRYIERWSPRTVRTDADGRFVVDGLAPGEIEYAATARGRSLARAEVEVKERETTTVGLELAKAARVFGRVLDADDQGIGGVPVRLFDSEPGLSYVQGGQVDFDETFGGVHAVTNEDGSFELRGTPTGTVHAVVVEVRQRKRRGTGRAHVYELLEIAPGAEFEWNPVLTDGRVIEGTALYRDGLPLAGQFVTLRSSSGEATATIVTDADGRFRFVCLDEPVYHVYVQVFDQPKGSPPVEQTGVVPDRGPIEIRATFDKPVEHEPATVVGAVLDAGRRLTNPKDATVLLVTPSNSWYTSNLDADGRFTFDSVDPGEVRLVVMDGETAVHHTDPFEIEPAEEHDVGVLTTSDEVGAARITLVRADGTEAFEPSFSLRRKDRRRGARAQPGTASTFEIGNLGPGDYTWSLYCKGAVSQSGEITLRTGAPAELEVELIPGATCKFDMRYAPDAEIGDATIVYTRDGAEFQRVEYHPGTAQNFRRYYVGLTLPPGSWHAVMTTTSGLRGEVEFTVESASETLSPILELR